MSLSKYDQHYEALKEARLALNRFDLRHWAKPDQQAFKDQIQAARVALVAATEALVVLENTEESALRLKQIRKISLT